MTWSRRRFLMGAGGLAVAIPVLPSLLGRAHAADGDPPKRLFVMYTGNGMYAPHWLPSGSGTSFTLQGALTALAPFQDRLCLVRGTEGEGGHYAGHTEALTGKAAVGDSFTPSGGPSLDQLVATGLKGTTPLGSLELGVDLIAGSSGMIAWTEGGLGIPPVEDAKGGFDRVYRVANADPATAERHRAQKLSVLDAVMDDYRTVQGKLSPNERRLLDEHLSLLEDQEDALLNPVEIGECEVGEGPEAGLGDEETAYAHVDSIAAAFRCDVTRVATLVFGGAQDTTRYHWTGCTDDAHAVAHGEPGDASAQMMAIMSWHCQQFANLLALLDAIPEGDGTVLDNTLCVWTDEIGLHNWSHSRDDMGVVLAGATGVIQGGSFVDASGYLYQDLLFTLAQAMGHTELDRFGYDGTRLVPGVLR